MLFYIEIPKYLIVLINIKIENKSKYICTYIGTLVALGQIYRW